MPHSRIAFAAPLGPRQGTTQSLPGAVKRGHRRGQRRYGIYPAIRSRPMVRHSATERRTELGDGRALAQPSGFDGCGGECRNRVPSRPMQPGSLREPLSFHRVLHIVEEVAAAGALGLPKGVVHVRSKRSTLEKKPWKQLPDREANIESRFVFQVHLGSTLVPFRMLEPERLIVPWDGVQMLDGSTSAIDKYPHLADWWRTGERLYWRGERTVAIPVVARPTRLPQVVAYTVSDCFPAALCIRRRGIRLPLRTWTPPPLSTMGSTGRVVRVLTKTRYLTAVLNSTEATRRVAPLQARGLFGARHFDKYVWWLPIPEFDPANSQHAALAAVAEHAEAVAADVDLSGIASFQTARKKVREALVAAGVAETLDVLVASLLG